VGAILTATRPHGRSFKRLSQGNATPQDSNELIEQLVQFAAAGFRAPALR